MFADMPLASEIVVSIHEAMEQIVEGSATWYRLQPDRADGPQSRFDRVVIVRDIDNSPRAITEVTGSGQGDKPFLLEFAQHGATGHILEQASFRPPIPKQAQFLGQTRPVPFRVGGDQLMYCLNIARC
jgi:hypothetical protein